MWLAWSAAWAVATKVNPGIRQRPGRVASTLSNRLNPKVALATVDVPTYAADALPPELAALPAEEPGSKRLRG